MNILSFKWGLASYNFIEGDSSCPDINFFIIAALNHFGSFVEKCSSRCVHLLEATSPQHHFTDSKVYDFNTLSNVVIKYILWLNISMADVILLPGGKTLKYFYGGFFA